ncbi:MAG: DNA-binding protein [Nanoarchaeota archaeon]|nr:DNA-binding protein [Nanoarchaeota archaeon]
MKISEVQPGMTKVDIEGEVIEIGRIRDVRTRYGKETRVADFTIRDESGSLKLTLWGDQIEKVKVGDKVSIKNGFAREWQGEIQVNVGKFGELKVL